MRHLAADPEAAAQELLRQLRETLGETVIVRVRNRHRSRIRLIVDTTSRTRFETVSVPLFFLGYSVAIRRRKLAKDTQRRI